MPKSRKVEESAGTYSVSPRQRARPVASAPKAGESGVRYLDDATARKLADKIFSERKNLLHKLAQ